jgi:CRISPR-associated protein Cmr5
MKTRQQQDALLARNHVQEIASENDTELKKKYARAVYRFPILIRQNGLQQTLGFYAGKAATESGMAEKKFLKHVTLGLGLVHDESNFIINHILEAELEEYLYFSRRCIEMATWYRRFTESLLKIDQTGNTVLDNEKKQLTKEKNYEH